MKKGTTIWSFFSAALLIILGCGKGVEPDNHIPTDLSDSTNPIVVINTPSNNQVFKNGDVIRVTGKVTDNSLYQGKIRIMDDASNIIVREQLYEIHGFQTYDFDVDVTADVLVTSHYTVTVFFEDHGLNPASQSVKITVNP